MYKIKNGYLEIKCPIEIRNGGKNNIFLATTSGIDTFEHDGKEISVNLNVWVKRSDYER